MYYRSLLEYYGVVPGTVMNTKHAEGFEDEEKKFLAFWLKSLGGVDGCVNDW